ncbi:hypothetical protein SBRCBS47491_003387 [Sporothrix bragantina]|uniref:Uncharacterized protein n=1 Tax=Sporothrix bragantina TaxID=671064 RepID=A0ABP0BFS2_9PEZI
MLTWPHRGHTAMEGPRKCSLADLYQPLRKCTFSMSRIGWLESLGGGLDGCCWKAQFGDKGPSGIDIDPENVRHNFALERECRSASLLQMMYAAVDAGNADS